MFFVVKGHPNYFLFVKLQFDAILESHLWYLEYLSYITYLRHLTSGGSHQLSSLSNKNINNVSLSSCCEHQIR